MAFLGDSTALLIVSLVMLQVINGSSSRLLNHINATTNDLSWDICSTTSDRRFCSRVMKTIPGAAQAQSPKSLGEIAIPYAHSQGREIVQYIRSLVPSAKNQLEKDYIDCANTYDYSVGELEQAQAMLKSRDYAGFEDQARSSLEDAVYCKGLFNDHPATDPSKLPQLNKYFDMLCAIILGVANRLVGE